MWPLAWIVYFKQVVTPQGLLDIWTIWLLCLTVSSIRWLEVQWSVVILQFTSDRGTSLTQEFNYAERFIDQAYAVQTDPYNKHAFYFRHLIFIGGGSEGANGPKYEVTGAFTLLK